jgi:hypothetical protein
MTAKALIAKLKKLPPNKPVLISNKMGCPAYDYDGQRFAAGSDSRTGTVTLTREVETNEDEE